MSIIVLAGMFHRFDNAASLVMVDGHQKYIRHVSSIFTTELLHGLVEKRYHICM